MRKAKSITFSQRNAAKVFAVGEENKKKKKCFASSDFRDCPFYSANRIGVNTIQKKNNITVNSIRH